MGQPGKIKCAMKTLKITGSIFLLAMLFACKKEEQPAPEPAPVPIPCLSYTALQFNKVNAYFVTGDTLKTPVDSTTAKKLAAKIDITFFFDSVYTEPGFMDPLARSKDWTWNDYKTSWLKEAKETRFYSTVLTKSDFDATRADTSRLSAIFASASTKPAPHAIYPTGACIGGRSSTNPASLKILKEKVFAFRSMAGNKRGLLYIRTDQPAGWPLPVLGTTTKVDIVREP